MKCHDWIFLMFTTIICCIATISIAQAQQRGRVKFGLPPPPPQQDEPEHTPASATAVRSNRVRPSAPRASSRFRTTDQPAISSSTVESKETPRNPQRSNASRSRSDDRASRKLEAEATDLVPALRSRKRVIQAAPSQILPTSDQPTKVQLPTTNIDRTNIIRRGKGRAESAATSIAPPNSSQIAYFRRRSDAAPEESTENIRKARTFTSRSVPQQVDEDVSSEVPVMVTTGKNNWRNSASKRGSAKVRNSERAPKSFNDDQLEDENYPEHFKLLLKKQLPKAALSSRNLPRPPLPVTEDPAFSRSNEVYEITKSPARQRRVELPNQENSEEILQVSRAIPKVRRVELKREDTARAALKSRRVEPPAEEVVQQIKIDIPLKSRRNEPKFEALKSRRNELSTEEPQPRREDTSRTPFKSRRNEPSNDSKTNEIVEVTKPSKPLFVPRRAEPYRPKPTSTTPRSTTLKASKRPELLDARSKYKPRVNARLQFPSLKSKATPTPEDLLIKDDNEIGNIKPNSHLIRPQQITKSKNLALDTPLVDTKKTKAHKFSSRYRGDAYSRYKPKTEASKPIYTPTIPAVSTEPTPLQTDMTPSKTGKSVLYNPESEDGIEPDDKYTGVVFDERAGVWNMVEPIPGGLTRSEISVDSAEEQPMQQSSSVTVSIFEALADILSKTPTTTTSTSTTTTTTTTSTTELPDIIQVPELKNESMQIPSTTVNTNLITDVDVEYTSTTNEITNNDRNGRILNSVDVNQNLSTTTTAFNDPTEPSTVPQYTDTNTIPPSLATETETEQTTITELTDPTTLALPAAPTTQPTITNNILTNFSANSLELTTIASNPPTSLPMPYLADALTTPGSNLITRPQLISAISNFLDTSVQNASDTMATSTTTSTTSTTGTLDTDTVTVTETEQSTTSDASTTLSTPPPPTTTFIPSTDTPPVTISFLDLFTIQPKKVNHNTEPAIDVHPIYKEPDPSTTPSGRQQKTFSRDQTTGQPVNIHTFFGTRTYPSIAVTGGTSTDRIEELTSTFRDTGVTSGVTTVSPIPSTTSQELDSTTYTSPQSSIRTQSIPIHLNSILGSTQKYDQTSPFKTVQTTESTTTIRSRFGSNRLPIQSAGSVPIRKNTTTTSTSTTQSTSTSSTSTSTSRTRTTTTTASAVTQTSPKQQQQLSNLIPDYQQLPKPIKDFSVYGILPNNTVVRKRPSQVSRTLDVGLTVYGILPNRTVVRKYPNGTLAIVDSSKDVEVVDIDPKMLFNPFSELYRTSQSSLLLTTHRSTTSHRLIESNHIVSGSGFSSSTAKVPTTAAGTSRKGNSIKVTTDSGNTEPNTTNGDDENLIQLLNENEDNLLNSTSLVEANTENAVLLDLLKRKYINTDIPSRSSNVVSLTTARNVIEESSIQANRDKDVSENTLFDSSEERKKDTSTSSEEDLLGKLFPANGSTTPTRANTDDDNVISHHFDTYANIGSIFTGNKGRALEFSQRTKLYPIKLVMASQNTTTKLFPIHTNQTDATSVENVKNDSHTVMEPVLAEVNSTHGNTVESSVSESMAVMPTRNGGSQIIDFDVFKSNIDSEAKEGISLGHEDAFEHGDGDLEGSGGDVGDGEVTQTTTSGGDLWTYPPGSIPVQVVLSSDNDGLGATERVSSSKMVGLDTGRQSTSAISKNIFDTLTMVDTSKMQTLPTSETKPFTEQSSTFSPFYSEYLIPVEVRYPEGYFEQLSKYLETSPHLLTTEESSGSDHFVTTTTSTILSTGSGVVAYDSEIKNETSPNTFESTLFNLNVTSDKIEYHKNASNDSETDKNSQTTDSIFTLSVPTSSYYNGNSSQILSTTDSSVQISDDINSDFDDLHSEAEKRLNDLLISNSKNESESDSDSDYSNELDSSPNTERNTLDTGSFENVPILSPDDSVEEILSNFDTDSVENVLVKIDEDNPMHDSSTTTASASLEDEGLLRLTNSQNIVQKKTTTESNLFNSVFFPSFKDDKNARKSDTKSDDQMKEGIYDSNLKEKVTLSSIPSELNLNITPDQSPDIVINHSKESSSENTQINPSIDTEESSEILETNLEYNNETDSSEDENLQEKLKTIADIEAAEQLSENSSHKLNVTEGVLEESAKEVSRNRYFSIETDDLGISKIGLSKDEINNKSERWTDQNESIGNIRSELLSETETLRKSTIEVTTLEPHVTHVDDDISDDDSDSNSNFGWATWASVDRTNSSFDLDQNVKFHEHEDQEEEEEENLTPNSENIDDFSSPYEESTDPRSYLPQSVILPRESAVTWNSSDSTSTQLDLGDKMTTNSSLISVDKSQTLVSVADAVAASEDELVPLTNTKFLTGVTPALNVFTKSEGESVSLPPDFNIFATTANKFQLVSDSISNSTVPSFEIENLGRNDSAFVIQDLSITSDNVDQTSEPASDLSLESTTNGSAEIEPGEDQSKTLAFGPDSEVSSNILKKEEPKPFSDFEQTSKMKGLSSSEVSTSIFQERQKVLKSIFTELDSNRNQSIILAPESGQTSNSMQLTNSSSLPSLSGLEDLGLSNSTQLELDQSFDKLAAIVPLSFSPDTLATNVEGDFQMSGNQSHTELPSTLDIPETFAKEYVPSLGAKNLGEAELVIPVHDILTINQNFDENSNITFEFNPDSATNKAEVEAGVNQPFRTTPEVALSILESYAGPNFTDTKAENSSIAELNSEINYIKPTERSENDSEFREDVKSTLNILNFVGDPKMIDSELNSTAHKSVMDTQTAKLNNFESSKVSISSLAPGVVVVTSEGGNLPVGLGSLNENDNDLQFWREPFASSNVGITSKQVSIEEDLESPSESPTNLGISVESSEMFSQETKLNNDDSLQVSTPSLAPGVVIVTPEAESFQVELEPKMNDTTNGEAEQMETNNLQSGPMLHIASSSSNVTLKPVNNEKNLISPPGTPRNHLNNFEKSSENDSASYKTKASSLTADSVAQISEIENGQEINRSSNEEANEPRGEEGEIENISGPLTDSNLNLVYNPASSKNDEGPPETEKNFEQSSEVVDQAVKSNSAENNEANLELKVDDVSKDEDDQTEKQNSEFRLELGKKMSEAFMASQLNVTLRPENNEEDLSITLDKSNNINNFEQNAEMESQIDKSNILGIQKIGFPSPSPVITVLPEAELDQTDTKNSEFFPKSEFATNSSWPPGIINSNINPQSVKTVEYISSRFESPKNVFNNFEQSTEIGPRAPNSKKPEGLKVSDKPINLDGSIETSEVESLAFNINETKTADFHFKPELEIATNISGPSVGLNLASSSESAFNSLNNFEQNSQLPERILHSNIAKIPKTVSRVLDPQRGSNTDMVATSSDIKANESSSRESDVSSNHSSTNFTHSSTEPENMAHDMLQPISESKISYIDSDVTTQSSEGFKLTSDLSSKNSTETDQLQAPINTLPPMFIFPSSPDRSLISPIPKISTSQVENSKPPAVYYPMNIHTSNVEVPPSAKATFVMPTNMEVVLESTTQPSRIAMVFPNNAKPLLNEALPGHFHKVYTEDSTESNGASPTSASNLQDLSRGSPKIYSKNKLKTVDENSNSESDLDFATLKPLVQPSSASVSSNFSTNSPQIVANNKLATLEDKFSFGTSTSNSEFHPEPTSKSEPLEPSLAEEIFSSQSDITTSSSLEEIKQVFVPGGIPPEMLSNLDDFQGTPVHLTTTNVSPTKKMFVPGGVPQSLLATTAAWSDSELKSSSAQELDQGSTTDKSLEGLLDALAILRLESSTEKSAGSNNVAMTSEQSLYKKLSTQRIELEPLLMKAITESSFYSETEAASEPSNDFQVTTQTSYDLRKEFINSEGTVPEKNSYEVSLNDFESAVEKVDLTTPVPRDLQNESFSFSENNLSSASTTGQKTTQEGVKTFRVNLGDFESAVEKLEATTPVPGDLQKESFSLPENKATENNLSSASTPGQKTTQEGVKTFKVVEKLEATTQVSQDLRKESSNLLGTQTTQNNFSPTPTPSQTTTEAEVSFNDFQLHVEKVEAMYQPSRDLPTDSLNFSKNKTTKDVAKTYQVVLNDFESTEENVEATTQFPPDLQIDPFNFSITKYLENNPSSTPTPIQETTQDIFKTYQVSLNVLESALEKVENEVKDLRENFKNSLDKATTSEPSTKSSVKESKQLNKVSYDINSAKQLKENFSEAIFHQTLENEVESPKVGSKLKDTHLQNEGLNLVPQLLKFDKFSNLKSESLVMETTTPPNESDPPQETKSPLPIPQYLIGAQSPSARNNIKQSDSKPSFIYQMSENALANMRTINSTMSAESSNISISKLNPSLGSSSDDPTTAEEEFSDFDNDENQYAAPSISQLPQLSTATINMQSSIKTTPPEVIYTPMNTAVEAQTRNHTETQYTTTQQLHNYFHESSTISSLDNSILIDNLKNSINTITEPKKVDSKPTTPTIFVVTPGTTESAPITTTSTTPSTTTSTTPSTTTSTTTPSTTTSTTPSTTTSTTTPSTITTTTTSTPPPTTMSTTTTTTTTTTTPMPTTVSITPLTTSSSTTARSAIPTGPNVAIGELERNIKLLQELLALQASINPKSKSSSTTSSSTTTTTSSTTTTTTTPPPPPPTTTTSTTPTTKATTAANGVDADFINTLRQLLLAQQQGAKPISTSTTTTTTTTPKTTTTTKPITISPQNLEDLLNSFSTPSFSTTPKTNSQDDIAFLNSLRDIGKLRVTTATPPTFANRIIELALQNRQATPTPSSPVYIPPRISTTTPPFTPLPEIRRPAVLQANEIERHRQDQAALSADLSLLSTLLGRRITAADLPQITQQFGGNRQAAAAPRKATTKPPKTTTTTTTTTTEKPMTRDEIAEIEKNLNLLSSLLGRPVSLNELPLIMQDLRSGRKPKGTAPGARINLINPPSVKTTTSTTRPRPTPSVQSQTPISQEEVIELLKDPSFGTSPDQLNIYGKSNDAVLAAVLKQRGIGPTHNNIPVNDLFLQGPTPTPYRTTRAPPPQAPPAQRRPLLDGLAWLWRAWQDTAPGTRPARNNRQPTAAASTRLESPLVIGAFGGAQHALPAPPPPTSSGDGGEYAELQYPQNQNQNPNPSFGQGNGLLTAAFGVTRAVTQFLGAAFQGAAKSVQSAFSPQAVQQNSLVGIGG